VNVRVTWWGHATALIDVGGVRLLTDPLLTDRLAHLRRIGSPPPDPRACGADAILVSHLHLDHLHPASLRAVDAGAVVVPRGAERMVAAATNGGRVQPIEPGDELRIGEVVVRAVAAQHDGRRRPGSPMRAPALGYLIEHDGTRIWFAGDTGLFEGMRAYGPVDVAVVPVGGWGPTLGPGHLDPGQAARACAAVQARHAVPIHYGTFWPVGLRRMHPRSFRDKFELPGIRFAGAVAGNGQGTRVHLPRCGQTATIDG
jgi:L-ascorbate metabolism protein UlaG (beta-lactamase superfamily)